MVRSVDHEKVLARVIEDSGWSPRYGFMTMMSPGIAVLGAAAVVTGSRHRRLLAVFVAMAVPLAISFEQIAREAFVTNQVRNTLAQRFRANARVTQLEIDFDADPLLVRSIISRPVPRRKGLRNRVGSARRSRCFTVYFG